jgi:CBS domain-containing protein
MTRDVRVADPNQSIREAAAVMAELDIGALPVAEDDRLIGMITDRDIVVRAISEGRGPDTPIREVMTPEIKYCYEDDSIDDVVENMADNQIRRLPVVNREKRLVGILALGDIALDDESQDEAAEALSGVSNPDGPFIGRH